MKAKSIKLKERIQKIDCINQLYTIWKWRQKKVSYGKEHSEQTFYVIRRASCKVGLFSYVMTNLGQIEYALQKGYIPVIDMQNNANTYLEENQIGKINAWELFFKQPCGFGLDDIMKSKNVILSCGLITEKSEYPAQKILNDQKEFKRWHELSRMYLKPKDSLKQITEQLKEEMFQKRRVLGVLCRGTDYVRMKPHGHPVQPTIEQMFEKTDEMMEKQKCEWIFLATEDDSYYQAFRRRYGERLKITDAKRCKDTGKFNINDVAYDRPDDRYLKGRDYLINIMLLAECDCLLAGAVGGTYGALLLNERYDEKFIFDLGVYD